MLLPRSALLIACSVMALGAVCQNARAGFVSDYQASSGLFPDQISPPYTLIDTADENPVLGGGILTLSTSANIEIMVYRHGEPVVDTSGAFFIETSVRFVSGASSETSRAPIMIAITTAPNVGNALFIGQDEVFFNVGNTTAGPKAMVDTDDAFHFYRIEYDGLGGLKLFRDDELDVPLLQGSTFASAAFAGPEERIAWGDLSQLAFGTSEWEFFRHNALAVPEPATLALVGIALAGLGLRRRYRAA